MVKKNNCRYAGRFAITGLAVFLVLSCSTMDPADKYPDMISDREPLSVGTIEFELDRFFSSNLDKKEAALIFYPRYNTVALEFRYQTIRYRQFWDLAGREKFIQALERYKEDYAAKNLVNKYSQSRSIYGKFKGKIEWETFSITTPGLAYPTMELGYRFRGKGNGSPYFAVLQQSAKDEYTLNSDSPKPDSLQICTYYTRAQAEELAKVFDQSFLLSLLGPLPDPGDALPDEEDYREGE
jgi:hypothetical protein